jgi:hypothetical protein
MVTSGFLEAQLLPFFYSFSYPDATVFVLLLSLAQNKINVQNE